MVIYCKECNGLIQYSCDIQKNGTTHEVYRCTHCGREIVEMVKFKGVEYK